MWWNHLSMSDENKGKKKIDRHTTSSDKKGVAGLFEVFIRKFRTVSFLLVLVPIIVLCLFIIGLAIAPAILIVQWTHGYFSEFSAFVHTLTVGMSVAIGFFAYGISMLFLVPLANFLMPFRVKPWRGNWRSTQVVPWYVHNALVYIVRYTFLDFVTPSPLLNMFYKLMGMKIGKGVIINTTNISDPCLIEIDDYVTIGGSVHILAHYGQKGYLILAPVKIGKGANIGLKASIMGDVHIGENATVKPHVAVLPKTRIEDNEIYG